MSALLMAVMLAGNIVHAARFTLIGRGHYLQALRYILRESPVEPIHVASNSDFRTSLLLAFYTRYLPRERQIVYHSRQEMNRSPTVDWWIVEFLDRHQHVPQQLDTAHGSFALQRYYDFYGPSGCGWAVYRHLQHSG